MSKQERISALKDVIKYFTTFFASIFFSYFPPLKSRSSESYSPKNMAPGGGGQRGKIGTTVIA